MSGAEMTIRLVDGTEAEKAAFDRSPTVPAPAAEQKQEKPAPVPAVGHVAPKQEDGPTNPASKPASIGDMFELLQNRIGKTRVGKRVNAVIDRVRKAGRAIGKTKAGRAIGGFARKAASRVAQSGFGKAVAGAGRAVGGAIARTVGSVAGGAVVSGGTASVAAAGGTTAAAGAATAAGAAALANPVGLAVGAVVASFATLALGAKALNDTFTSEADRLEKFSAGIAIARGMGKISTELNMLDRAKKLDGPLGNLESSKAALNSSMEKLWTDMLTLLFGWEPVLTKGIDLLNLIATEARKGVATLEVASATSAVIEAAKTPDANDDQPAKDNLVIAAKNLADTVKLQKEAFDRLVGNAPANQPGGDPFLRSLLNAKVGP